jgi:hypothetical protein
MAPEVTGSKATVVSSGIVIAIPQLPKNLTAPEHVAFGVVFGNGEPDEEVIMCAFEGCTGATFGRLVDLRRHYKQFHGDDSSGHWCPVQGCSRSQAAGGKSFPGVRHDKLSEHIRIMHPYLNTSG